MLPLMRPHLAAEASANLGEVLDSRWWTYGPRCKELESRFAQRGGWALATSSCTAALYLAALACRRGEQNEVIVPAITFVSTGMAFAAAGYRVVVCDVCDEDLTISPARVAECIGPATRAIVPVHLYGQKVCLSELRDLCDRRDISLIEDCAHRIDLLDKEPPLGDFACYSFNAVKELPCGEGGLLWSRNETGRVAAERWSYLGLDTDMHTRSSDAVHRKIDYCDSWGLKLRLTDLLAALVLTSLPSLATFRQQRARILATYQDVLTPYTDRIRLLPRAASDSFLMVVARVEPGIRDSLRARLAGHQVATSVHYTPLHRHPRFDGRACPVADKAAGALLTLPSYIGLTAQEVADLAPAFGCALHPGRARA